MRKIECEQPFDAEFTAYLESLKPHTKNAYRAQFAYWLNFSHMNGKETLEFKRNDKDAQTEGKVLAFKAYLQRLGKSDNYAKLGVSAISGFLTSHRLKLEFTPSESKVINEANRKTKDYRFVPSDLAKMSEQANLEEKYVILVGKSVGLRASDFVTFTYGSFRGIHLEGEAPIGLGEMGTQKEHIKAFPFLDSDAVQVVKAMLERNPNAKNEERILDVQEEQLTEILRRVFDRTHLESGGKRVRFHCLRAYLSTKLSAVCSESQWKQFVGKKIPEEAYIGQDELREIYLRAMPSIIINGNGKNHVAIEELKSALAQAEDERRAEKTRREQTEKRLEEVLAILAKKNIDLSKGVIDRGIDSAITEDDKILYKFIQETEQKKKEKVQVD